MANDAQIIVGADASAAERVAALVKQTWRDLGSSITSSIGDAAKNVVSDFASVATAQGKINFSSQFQQVREFEGASARLAVAMGRDLEGVRGSLEATGKSIGKRPAEVADWTSSVGQLTYNIGGAAEAIKGMSGLAAETGRDVNSYRSLAVTLGTVGHVAGDTTHAIGVMQAQADALGTQGGIAAFADQVDGLRDSFSRLSGTKKDFYQLTALAAVLGKDLSKDASARVQQTTFNTITSDPRRWERYLGRSLMNEHGQIEAKEVPQILQDIVSKAKRVWGKDARRVLMLPGNLGNEAGAAAFNADFSEVARIGNLPPSTKAPAAQKKIRDTDAGKRDVAEADLAISSRELFKSSGKMGTAADKLQQFAAKNPFTSTLVTTALTMGAGSFTSALGGHIAKMMGGTGEGGAVGGLLQLAGKGVGAAALGTAGTAAVVGGLAVVAGGALAGGDDYLSGKTYSDAVHTKTGEDKWNDRKTSLLKQQRDRARAAKGMPALPGASEVSAEDTELARATASGSKESVEALVSKLKSEGTSEQDAQLIAKTVAAAVKASLASVTIVNSTGGTVAISVDGAQSPAAGDQKNYSGG